MGTAMERVSVRGGELEFACVGSCDAVVFIHGGGIADTGLPPHGPRGPEQADQDAATFFESDVLSGQEWHFGAEQATKITQPVLFLTGTESLPIFGEVRDRLHGYLPQVEDDVMPGANHLLHLRYPADAVARLAGFLKRHPIAA